MIRFWSWILSLGKKDKQVVPEVETRSTHIVQEFPPVTTEDSGLPTELERIIREQLQGEKPDIVIGNVREDGHWYDDNGKRL